MFPLVDIGGRVGSRWGSGEWDEWDGGGGLVNEMSGIEVGVGGMR